MAYLYALLFASALLKILGSSPVDDDNPSDLCASSTPLAKNINEFGFQLSSTLDQTRNVFISPFSIYTAIMMAYMGAKRNTAMEIRKALKLRYHGLSDSVLRDSFKTLLERFSNDAEGHYCWETANGLFLQKGFKVKQEYLRDVNDFKQVTVKQLDFVGASEAAQREINEWVSNATHGKIRQMLPEAPSGSTKFMILNAIYFKGFWKTPFNKSDTHDGIFHKINGEQKRVKMMKMAEDITQRFNYHRDERTGHKYLELPYKGDQIVMLLSLPPIGQNISDTPMNAYKLCDVSANLELHKMDKLVIPKFSLEYETELKNQLIGLGIRHLFAASRSAGLGGISDAGDLFVSSIFFKSVLDVNEEGTEAAAATKVIGVGATMIKNEFVADHPFMLYIVDKENGLILFSGGVTDP